MKSLAWTFACLALAAAVLVALWSTRDPGPARAAGAPRAADRPATIEAARDQTPRAAPDRAAPDAGASELGARQTAESVPGQRATEPGTLRVVAEMPEGTPLGRTVHWLWIETEQELGSARRLLDSWDPDEFRRLGQVAMTRGQSQSADHLERVVSDSAGLVLCADSNAGVIGALELEAGAAGEHTLVVDRVARLAVELVDDLGAPLRGRVSLAGAALGESEGSNRLISKQLVSDEAGLATAWLHTGEVAAGALERPWMLQARVGFFTSDAATLSGSDWARPGEPLGTPVRVQLPRGGSAELSVTLPDGAAPSELIEIVVARPNLGDPSSVHDWILGGEALQTLSREFSLRLDGIPLGAPLSLWAGVMGREPSGPVAVRGPTDPCTLEHPDESADVARASAAAGLRGRAPLRHGRLDRSRAQHGSRRQHERGRLGRRRNGRVRALG